MSLEIGKIRNLVLVGHGNTGKTTLVEALLHKVGVTQRIGTVEQGNTVCDFDDLEKERKHSIDSAAVWFDYNGYRIDLIDTPGYPDFIGQALTSLAGVETALIVVSAVTGLEVNTRKMFAAAGDYGLARAVVVKDAGDDPDVTHGAHITADVSWRDAPGLDLDGGEQYVSVYAGS